MMIFYAIVLILALSLAIAKAAELINDKVTKNRAWKELKTGDPVICYEKGTYKPLQTVYVLDKTDRLVKLEKFGWISRQDLEEGMLYEAFYYGDIIKEMQ